MKVAVVRGGGIAGISARTELSTNALSSEDARTFADKVERANLQQSQPPSEQGWPDQMLYEMVLDDGTAQTRVHFTDETIPESVRQLVDWIDSRPESSHGLPE